MGMQNLQLDVISITNNIVPKKKYEYFEKSIEKLCDFIKIFKSDLKEIEIEKKENGDFYICELIMVYEAYKINAEFESTGIKKLIKLYRNGMIEGSPFNVDSIDFIGIFSTDEED